MKNKTTPLTILLCLALALMPLVSSVGVSTPYWDEKPLKLAPGESETVTLNLQNMVGGNDILVEAELTEDGSGIAVIGGSSKNYLIPYGRDDIPFEINVAVPENAELSGIHFVTIAFKQLAQDSGGRMLELTGAFTSKFPVEVVNYDQSELRTKEPVEVPQTNNNLWVIIVAVLLVSAIAFFVVKKKQKNNSKKI